MISTAPFLFHLGLDSASSPISRRVVQPTTKPKGGQGSHPCLFKPLSLIGFFENIRNVYTNRSKNQLRSWALQSNCCTYNLTSLIYFNITPSGHSKYRANISCLVSWNLKYLWICDTISLILGKTLGSFQKIHGGEGNLFCQPKIVGWGTPGPKGTGFQFKNSSFQCQLNETSFKIPSWASSCTMWAASVPWLREVFFVGRPSCKKSW